MTIVTITDGCIVLGEVRYGRSAVQVMHLPDDEYPHRHGGYQYAVRLNHVVEIRCNSEESAWILFFDILVKLKEGQDVSWMFTHV